MKHYYQDDYCTIYHGDCREILPSLPRVDLVLTDPPYGILNLDGSGSSPCVRKSPRQIGSGKLKNRILNQSNVMWDIAPDVTMFDALRAVSTYQIIWGGNYFPLPPTRAILVWDKEQPWENFSQVEIAWTNLDRPAALFRESTCRGVPDKLHPTQKPLSLMLWCLQMTENGLVLDPYIGSGTTLRAAKDLGRKAIGIEIEERYCEIAAKRLAQEVLQLV